MDAKKQTAVEWLEEKRKWAVITNEDIEQALAMEKEQIELAFRDGWFDGNNPLIFNIENERYYNETYNK